jgi:hypothetical protein
VPALDYPGPDSIILPAPDFERAAQMFANWSPPRQQHQSGDALSFPSGLLDAAWEHKAVPLNALGNYFDGLFKGRQTAGDAAREALKAFKVNGNKLPREALEELFARRLEILRSLESMVPPMFRFEILRPEDAFDRIEDVLAAQPGSKAAQHSLRHGHRQLNKLASEQNLAKYIEAPKTVADRFKSYSHYFLALEVALPVAQLVMADDDVEANKAAAELAKVAGGLVGGWTGSAFVAGASGVAKAVLGVAIAGTPAGWVIIGVGFAVGLTAGIWLGNAAKDKWLKTFVQPILP